MRCSCFDNRFEAAGRKLLKRIGIVQPDPIRIAGGADVIVQYLNAGLVDEFAIALVYKFGNVTADKLFAL